VTLHNRQT